jgi:alkaline phosphatase D
MAQLERKQGEGEGWSSDGWDGYPAGLQRILSQIADQKIENVVVIGGDIHSFLGDHLKQDFGDPNAPTVATEFVGTSVTSKGVSYDIFNGFLPENPHIRFFESRERGYVLVDISPELWRTDLRVVDTITQPEATARTLGSYVVEQGKAGAQEA